MFFLAAWSIDLKANKAGMEANKPAIAGMVDLATPPAIALASPPPCLLYTSDAADD